MNADATCTVFVYDIHLDPARMARVAPGARDRRPGRLLDHRLVFERIALERDGTGYANAAVSPGDTVEGAVYTATHIDLMRLDRSLGHPVHVSRRLVAVETEDGSRLACWTWFTTPDWRAHGLVPHPDHVAGMRAGSDVLGAAYRKALPPDDGGAPLSAEQL